MRSAHLPWICLPLLVVLSACAPETEAGSSPQGSADTSDAARSEEALAEIDRRWEEAANRGDAAAIASLYEEDGTLLPPDSDIVRGPGAIRETLQGYIDTGMTNVDFTRVDVGVSGDLAYEVGRYSYDIVAEGAEPVTQTGKYVIVARRGPDGSWRLVTDIFNSGPPAP